MFAEGEIGIPTKSSGLSWLERAVHIGEVRGSNPLKPTKQEIANFWKRTKKLVAVIRFITGINFLSFILLCHHLINF